MDVQYNIYLYRTNEEAYPILHAYKQYLSCFVNLKICMH